MRMPFFDTWRKMQANQQLVPLEKELANIIAQHPEYHAILNNLQENLECDLWPDFPGINPFFHMALHQAIHEQISTNRPNGILEIYKNLTQRYGTHEAEHCMMETLATFLSKIQQSQNSSEQDYLKALTALLQ